MIPKRIHYTWFSKEPFPEKIKKCIDSWHNCMPNYEFVLWDSERITEIKSIWLKECLQQRKWAFAADMVRLYAVYNYGGVYLDTDCFVYKPFDELLSNECFIGKENSIHIEGRSTQQYLTSHCFGAERNNEFIGRCLSYYDERHFILSENEAFPFDLKFSTLLLPFIQSEFAKQIGYNPYPSYDTIQQLDRLTVYPSQYFDVTKKTERAYCKHLALGAWREYQTPEDVSSISYKIRWRLERFVSSILNHFGYVMIRKQ